MMIQISPSRQDIIIMWIRNTTGTVFRANTSTDGIGSCLCSLTAAAAGGGGGGGGGLSPATTFLFVPFIRSSSSRRSLSSIPICFGLLCLPQAAPLLFLSFHRRHGCSTGTNDFPFLIIFYYFTTVIHFTVSSIATGRNNSILPCSSSSGRIVWGTVTAVVIMLAGS